MTAASRTRIPEIIKRHEADLLKEWITLQLSAGTLRSDLLKESQLREQSSQFLERLREALQAGGMNVDEEGWAPVRALLHEMSALRARQGFSPNETATFVLSFKQPLFERLRHEYAKDGDALASELWTATVLFDRLALLTTEAFQKSREEVIARQQKELTELSTPVVQLWEGVLALPLIGTLDSERTQVVMQNLLQKIVETGSSIAIIDITGVPLVDTLVAQHLLKTIAAARLMGADCIISGIRPQIAQTIVHLGVDLHDVVTKATLSGALAVAFQRTGHVIMKGTPQDSAAPNANGAGRAPVPSRAHAGD
ncbi:STAS domain-containing protein [Candidatus Nitrospira bockiana]